MMTSKTDQSQGVGRRNEPVLRNPHDMQIDKETGLPVMMADDPLTAVVMGAGKALDEISLLREVAVH